MKLFSPFLPILRKRWIIGQKRCVKPGEQLFPSRKSLGRAITVSCLPILMVIGSMCFRCSTTNRRSLERNSYQPYKDQRIDKHLDKREEWSVIVCHLINSFKQETKVCKEITHIYIKGRFKQIIDTRLAFKCNGQQQARYKQGESHGKIQYPLQCTEG